MDSHISGLYNMDPSERIETVIERCDLSSESKSLLREQPVSDTADRLSENVIGSISLPLSVATNFKIDGTERLVPMATEESSVVAAASHGARMARSLGGFFTSTSGPYMIAQIQVTDLSDPNSTKLRVLERRSEIRDLANDQGVLVSHGGGCEDVDARVLETDEGQMLVVHLLVNTQEAMGANAVNTMAEGVAPLVKSITGGTVILRILSNLADCRLARARCRVDPAEFEREDVDLSGPEIRDRIVEAWAFAAADPYRAATHNKGVMNGIDSLALATLNDWRALEAGAHAYAARDGYGPLTTYEVDDDGYLSCSIELPVQVGTVGGATGIHPMAQTAMDILDVDSTSEFAGTVAAVGLAENLASMRALVSEGIQSGHMRLHARNVAIEAGATGDMVDEIATKMVEEGTVRQSLATELLNADNGG